MVSEASKKEAVQTIPEHLIYEELDGIPVYYRGYKEVIAGNKTLQDIMGYGGLQWFIVNILADYLKSKIGKSHWVLGGEGGLHLRHKLNFSLDIGIYQRDQLSVKTLKTNYLSISPQIVIEVDTKADPDIFKHSSYYAPKTQHLLDFGVEQVVWLFTDPRKVMVATQESPWLTVNWSDEISVLGQVFTIEKIIEEAESQKSDL